MLFLSPYMHQLYQLLLSLQSANAYGFLPAFQAVSAQSLPIVISNV